MVEKTTFYAVCGTQRVGSTLLCETLATNGRAGAPREPFFSESERACAPGLGLPPDVPDYGAYVEETVASDRRAGVFGFKIMWNHHRRFLARLGEIVDEPRPPAGLVRVFPGLRAVHLTRSDKVQVAISQWRAERTGQWSLPAASDRAEPPGHLDVERVTELHELAHHAEDGWPAVLRDGGVPHRTLVYEEWAVDPAGTASDVARFLGVPGDGIHPPPMRTQRDERTRDWQRQWSAEVGCPTCPVDDPHGRPRTPQRSETGA